MSKCISAITAALLAALLALGPGAPAAQAVPDSLPPDTGDLVIHKYAMLDIAQAGGAGTGELLTEELAGAEPLNDISFAVYRVTVPNGSDAYPGDGPYTVEGAQVTDAGGRVFAIALVDTVTTGETAYGKGTAVLADLPQGVYLVQEQSSPLVTAVLEPFLVAVPMTNPAGTGWLETVHVYPKNEAISIKKTVSHTSVTVGDTVTYTLTATVPGNIGSAQAYSIADPLNGALALDPETVSVVAAATEAGLEGGVALALDTQYTVTGALTVSLTEAGRGVLEDGAYKYVQATFAARVTAGILDEAVNTVPNTATLHFTNAAGRETQAASGAVATHTGSIRVQKRDNNTDAPLGGAVFKIASSEANARAGDFLRQDGDDNLLDVGDAGYGGGTDWTLTTAGEAPDAGVLTFAGIQDYTTVGEVLAYRSYWLVEVTAPDGYNLLPAPVEVVFDGTATADTVYTIPVTVRDSTGFTLPVTGGRGTVLFTVGGIVLIGAAVLLLILQRKKKKGPRDT